MKNRSKNLVHFDNTRHRQYWSTHLRLVDSKIYELEPWSSYVGSVVDRAAQGQVSTEYFVIPCHSFILLIAPQSSPSGTVGQQTAAVIVDSIPLEPNR
jgi:hypothetical protein